MRKMVWVTAAVLIILTGCAGVEANEGNGTVPTETAVSADSPGTADSEPKSGTAEDTPGTDGEGSSGTPGEGDAAPPPGLETLTEPPSLTVSTLNATDRVTASLCNSQWDCTLPDGTTAALCVCGAHPLDPQEHPVLYTAFPAGSLPPAEEGANLGAMAAVFYLDFGEILPEAVSAVRWPSSHVGGVEGHTDFEEVIVEASGETITLLPFGDGDYVYEISARWGETGYASYTFRALPQARGEEGDELAGILEALGGLEYQPYTCDGLPEYRLTAADGTVYAVNLTDRWVWRGNREEAELPDALIAQLRKQAGLVPGGG